MLCLFTVHHLVTIEVYGRVEIKQSKIAPKRATEEY